jgi:hypothetical protein
MRDIEVIDGELRLLSRAWRVARHMGCTPRTSHIDALLDERNRALKQLVAVGPAYARRPLSSVQPVDPRPASPRTTAPGHEPS